MFLKISSFFYPIIYLLFVCLFVCFVIFVFVLVFLFFCFQVKISYLLLICLSVYFKRKVYLDVDRKITKFNFKKQRKHTIE